MSEYVLALMLSFVGSVPDKDLTGGQNQGFRIQEMVVTAYCPCRRCCGDEASGKTATGSSAWKPGIAADPKLLEYGTQLFVPGYGLSVVDDTGGAMRKSGRRGVYHIDLRMTYHHEAREWGRRTVMVRVYD